MNLLKKISRPVIFSLGVLCSSPACALDDVSTAKSCIRPTFEIQDEYAREKIETLKNELEALKKDQINSISIKQLCSKAMSLGGLGYVFNTCVRNDMPLLSFIILISILRVAENR